MLALRPQYLSVTTCVVDRIFEADSTALDFGELAVGQAKQVPLRIRNHSATLAPFSFSGLNALGPFSILNALRDVSARCGMWHSSLLQTPRIACHLSMCYFCSSFFTLTNYSSCPSFSWTHILWDEMNHSNSPFENEYLDWTAGFGDDAGPIRSGLARGTAGDSHPAFGGHRSHAAHRIKGRGRLSSASG